MTMTADKVAGTAHVSWVRWGLRPVDDYVDADNPVRFIEAFVDEVDLATAGFVRVEAKATGRPGYAPAEGGLPVGVPCVRAALPAARPLWARAACRGWGAKSRRSKTGITTSLGPRCKSSSARPASGWTTIYGGSLSSARGKSWPVPLSTVKPAMP